MRTSGQGAFTFADYTEAPYGEVDGGPKVITTTVTNTYSGVIDGQGRQAYLGLFRGDGGDGEAGTGAWVGLELITGRVGGRSGSFAVEQRGTFDSAGVTGSWQVVPDSATGELRGLRGEGGFTYTMGEASSAYAFDYELP